MRTQREHRVLHGALHPSAGVLHGACNSSARADATGSRYLPAETVLVAPGCNTRLLHDSTTCSGAVNWENTDHAGSDEEAALLLHSCTGRHRGQHTAVTESENLEVLSMSAWSDPWSYVVLAGVAAGVLYFRRNTPPASENRELVVVDEPSPSGPTLRRLDVVTVRCEHLDHHPGYAPKAVLTRAHSSRDLRALRRLGWGGDDHTSSCRYHNPAGQTPLDKVHVLCDAGCGERDVLRTSDVEAEFGRLAGRGWTNTDEGAVWCPYCSGNRDRPRW